MNEALHSLRLTEILDRTAQMYRSRFLVFLGIATIPAGTMFVFFAGLFGLIAWIGANAKSGLTTSNVIVWTFVIVLSILVVPATLGSSAIGEAAMCDAAARLFLGQPVTIRSAYKTTWVRGWRYVGLYVMQGLVIVAAPAIVFSVVVGVMIATRVRGYATNDTSPLFGGLMFVAFLAVGAFAVWMLLRLCLAFPVSVVEQASAMNALKRGSRLSHGTQGRILLLYVLGLFLNQIVVWVIAVPAMIVIALIPGFQGQAHAQALGIIMTFVFYGAMFVVRAVTKPVYGIALTLFYFDQRIRKEGFDIEWMMQQAGLVQGGTVHESAAAPEASASTEWVTEPVGELPIPIEQTVELLNPVAVREESMTSVREEGNA